MPNMDGYQLSAKVRELYPDVKIQIASGFADDRKMGTVDESLQKKFYLLFENERTIVWVVAGEES